MRSLPEFCRFAWGKMKKKPHVKLIKSGPCAGGKHFGMDLRREMGLGIPWVPPESALHGTDSTNYFLVVIPVWIWKYKGISFVFWWKNQWSGWRSGKGWKLILVSSEGLAVSLFLSENSRQADATSSLLICWKCFQFQLQNEKHFEIIPKEI